MQMVNITSGHYFSSEDDHVSAICVNSLKKIELFEMRGGRAKYWISVFLAFEFWSQCFIFLGLYK